MFKKRQYPIVINGDKTEAHGRGYSTYAHITVVAIPARSRREAERIAKREGWHVIPKVDAVEWE